MPSSDDVPHLLQTVIDTPAPRELAEFYRSLLGLRYRDGDAPDADESEQPEWLVLTADDGTRRLAFQLAPDLPRPQWPTGSPPQMLHLDLTVDSTAALEQQRARALRLGAAVLNDRSADVDEPLIVFADPSGHPFCIFVAPRTASRSLCDQGRSRERR
ncbi:VOC family protein [Curtobacterium sp. MCPF17_047]|uniref:VOC family protein n=2 Tax=Curtobacterium TaxID=2034 RepID=UPI000DA8787C|nr:MULTISPECIES: VOC family protein [unclassified Curtobacterium]PZE56964.1 VOC family protein [Curtobacterium sp. MCPF17_001]PZF64006.1 VOC family protein [Curtobacterium sp. MCPF17_047]